MSGYNFKLQKLLDIRIKNEEECIRTFQTKQMEKVEIEDKLDNLKANYSKYSNVSNIQNTVQQKIRYSYLRVLDTAIKDTAVELSKKEQDLFNSIEELKVKQTERKTVEILRSKGELAYLKEQALIEQKLNDEFALYGHVRRVKGGEI